MRISIIISIILFFCLYVNNEALCQDTLSLKQRIFLLNISDNILESKITKQELNCLVFSNKGYYENKEIEAGESFFPSFRFYEISFQFAIENTCVNERSKPDLICNYSKPYHQIVAVDHRTMRIFRVIGFKSNDLNQLIEAACLPCDIIKLKKNRLGIRKDYRIEGIEIKYGKLIGFHAIWDVKSTE
jgi:hypothetical protein